MAVGGGVPDPVGVVVLVGVVDISKPQVYNFYVLKGGRVGLPIYLYIYSYYPIPIIARLKRDKTKIGI